MKHIFFMLTLFVLLVLTACQMPSTSSAIDLSKYELVRSYGYNSGAFVVKSFKDSSDFADLDLNGVPDPFASWEEYEVLSNVNIITINIYYDSDPILSEPGNGNYPLASYEDIIAYGAIAGTVFIDVYLQGESYGYSSGTGSLVVSNSDGSGTYTLSINGQFDEYETATDLTVNTGIKIFGTLYRN